MAQDQRNSFLQASARRGWVIHGVDDQHCMVELPKQLWRPGMIVGGVLAIAGLANLIIMALGLLIWVAMFWECFDRKKRLYCLTWEQIEKREFPDELFVE